MKARTQRGPLAAILLALGALTLLPSCGEDCNPVNSDGPTEKMWTFMLYDASDLNDAYDPFDDFCERMRSGTHLDVVVLQDTRHDSARIWHVGSGGGRKAVRELGEVNTGRPETLQTLLEYSAAHYPSARRILAVYGHGQGWLGACPDASDGNDYLTMEEIRSALSAAGGADLVLFTGTCLMAAIESAYELRNCCEVYVGSENLSYYCWWDYPMEDICSTLKSDPDISTLDLAESIIGFIREDSRRWSAFDWDESLTMSAIRTDRLEEVVGHLNLLAADYIEDPGRLREAMDEAGPGVTVFYNHYPDIYDLARAIRESEPADTTRELLRTLMADLDSALVAECHDEALGGAHGLTVYFPFESHSGSTSLYGPGTGLDFILSTLWDELLEAYPYPPTGTFKGGAGAPSLPHRADYSPGGGPEGVRMPRDCR
jgi:hypothetical protein